MDEVSLSSADLIVLGIIGLLLLVGLISAVRSYLRWRSTRPGRERIALAFPLDLPHAPEVDPVPRHLAVETPPSIPARVDIGIPVPVEAGPSPATAGSRTDVGVRASGVASTKPAKAGRPARVPAPRPEPDSGDIAAHRVEPATPMAKTTGALPEVPAAAGTFAGAATASRGSTAASAARYPIGDLLADGGELVEGKTIVFHRPMPGTMRLLPGRLEIEEGEDGPAEIRFVDIPGVQPEVTFGRRRGEPFRHVQLRSLTVSREHARLTREGTDWVITNLSRTNPIVVNGETLEEVDQRHVLRDGDRIEMGEVVFRYRGG